MAGVIVAKINTEIWEGAILKRIGLGFKSESEERALKNDRVRGKEREMGLN